MDVGRQGRFGGRLQRTRRISPAPAAETLPGRGGDKIRWTLIYVAFLVYIFVIITYRLPLGDAAVGAGLIGLFFQREPLRFSSLLLWLAAFIVWGAIGAIQSEYPDVAWEQITNFGKLWLIVLIATNALRSRSQILFFMVFSLFFYALYPARGAIFNYVFYNSTVFGRAIWNHIYANPNDLAALTLLQLSIAAAVFAVPTGKWVRWGALVSLVVLPILILMTQSRGAFMAFALFVLLSLKNQRKKMRSLAFLLVAGAIIVAVAPSGVWERVGGLTQATNAEEVRATDSSAEQRYLIWQVAEEMIQDHPLFGVGLGAYAYAHDIYSQQDAAFTLARGRRDTHSTYLNVIAETGYPGFLIFLGILGSVVLRVEQTRRKLKREAPQQALQLWYLEIGLLAYLTAGIFGSFAKLSFLYLHLTLMWTLAETYRNVPSGQQRIGRRTERPIPRRRVDATLPVGAVR